jgi:RND superfamily putative drug exporter
LLLDTFIVRSVLVTALNLDVGRWIWWPSSLHRKRDVELGELEEEAAAVTPLIHIAAARPDSGALAGQPTRPDLPGPQTPAPGGRLATVL